MKSFKKITNPFLPFKGRLGGVILIFVSILSGGYYVIAGLGTAPNTISTGSSAGSITKGLVAHWLLDEESEKVGSELVMNGGFDNWTGDDPDSWTLYVAEDASNYVTESSGTVRLVSNKTGGQFGIWQDLGLVAGKRYRYEFDLVVTSGGCKIYWDTGSGVSSTNYTTSGNKTLDFTYVDYAGHFGIFNYDATSDFTADNVKVVELHTADKTPNSNHGTLYQDSTIFTTDQKGNANRAMSFNGTSDYVDGGSGDSLNITDERTVNIWIKTSVGGAFFNFAYWGHPQDGSDWFEFYPNVRSDNGALEIWAYSLNAGVREDFNVSDSSYDYRDNNWHNITIIFKTSEATGYVYIDGDYFGSDTFAFSDWAGATSHSPVHIGKARGYWYNSGGYSYFNGSISDVRIYNRALSADEVSILYNSYRPKIAVGDLNKGLVGHWALDGEGEKNFGYGTFVASESDWVGVPNSSNYNFGTSDFSIGFWVKFNTVSGYIPHYDLVGNFIGSTAGFRVLFTGKNTSEDGICFYSSGGNLNQGDRDGWSIDTWYYVTVVRASGTVNIYRDTAVVATGAVGDLADSSGRLIIGADSRNDPPTGYFQDGDISDVRIYNRALTTAEITTLSKGENIGKSVVTSGLAGWWRMNDYTDSSGNGNNGTNYGSVITRQTIADKTPNSNNGTVYGTDYTTDQKGNANRAMSFDGVGDWVDGGNPADGSLDFGTSDFSISGWIKVNNLDTHRPVVSKNAWANGSYLMTLDASSKNFYFYIRDITGAVAVTDTINNGAIPFIGSWVHYVVVVDRSDKAHIYINNSELSYSRQSDISALGSLDNSLPLLIGKYGSGTFFNGSISDVRIYNRALSQTEITQLYNSYRPKVTSGSLQKGLVLDMPLKQKYMKSATVFTDRTPWGNDGTNSGAVAGEEYATFVAAESDYVDCGSGTSLDINQGTLEMWFKPTATIGVGSGRLDLLHKLGAYTFLFNRDNDGKIEYEMVGVYDGPGLKTITTSWTAGTWYHLVGTYNGSNIRIYVNGVEENSNLATGTTTVKSDVVWIGGKGGVDYYFNGDISNVRIYNRALSEEEILLLYSKGR